MSYEIQSSNGCMNRLQDHMDFLQLQQGDLFLFFIRQHFHILLKGSGSANFHVIAWIPPPCLWVSGYSKFPLLVEWLFHLSGLQLAYCFPRHHHGWFTIWWYHWQWNCLEQSNSTFCWCRNDIILEFRSPSFSFVKIESQNCWIMVICSSEVALSMLSSTTIVLLVYCKF